MAATLGDAGAAYSYNPSPDFDALRAEWRASVPAAASQAFFSLSLGMGAMKPTRPTSTRIATSSGDTDVIMAVDTGITFLTGDFADFLGL